MLATFDTALALPSASCARNAKYVGTPATIPVTVTLSVAPATPGDGALRGVADAKLLSVIGCEERRRSYAAAFPVGPLSPGAVQRSFHSAPRSAARRSLTAPGGTLSIVAGGA